MILNVLILISATICRRGCYANGHTNANTFWYSVFDENVGSNVDRMKIDNVPEAYYKSYYEDSYNSSLHRLRGKPGYRPMIRNKKWETRPCRSLPLAFGNTTSKSDWGISLTEVSSFTSWNVHSYKLSFVIYCSLYYLIFFRKDYCDCLYSIVKWEG